MLAPSTGELSAAQIERLARWKLRYTAEAIGFDRATARRLAFTRWLVATNRLRPGDFHHGRRV